MSEDLLINLVPISVSRSPIRIHISDNVGAAPNQISARDVGRPDTDAAWSWDLEPFPGSNPFEVAPTNFPATKRIIRKFLRDHLVNRGLIVGSDFIQRLRILQYSHAHASRHTDVFKEFVVEIMAPKAQHAAQPHLWHLSIEYHGNTESSKITYREIGDACRFATTVIAGRSIRRVRDLSTAELAADDVRPIISKELRKALGFQLEVRRPTNKYREFFDEISSFSSGHLKGTQLSNGFAIFDTGFESVADAQVIRATEDSNILVFADDHTHFSPYNGLKEYGPFRGVQENYKLFFIFHKDDADYANRLYSSLSKGLRGFPGLQRFVALELRLDRGKTINFEREDPTSEIEEGLKRFAAEDGTRYLAVYISRIKKDEKDDRKRYVYYKVKRALLAKNITSQVVHRENIDSPSFHYFLPNIAVAMLAKLGGIPWRLSRPIRHDLVVGLGAFREGGNNLFLGTTVAFRNDGTFIRFDSAQTKTVEDLVSFFRGVLASVPKEWPDAKRLVVHFYKEMNWKEEQAVRKALDSLGLLIPYVVVSIVEDTHLVPFDSNYPGKMPTSGTCVVLRHGDYLLCNNTRYSTLTGAKLDDFPLPIRIKISRTSIKDLEYEDIKQLIDEVYQFSRMYWVSVRQKGKPVTVLYSERVAAFRSAFPETSLPDSAVAKTSLWFL